MKIRSVLLKPCWDCFKTFFQLFLVMEAIHEHDALQDAAALGLLLANPHVYLKELEEGERRHLADPFAVGRWVKLHGLKRQALNNCVGMIIRDANGQ